MGQMAASVCDTNCDGLFGGIFGGFQGNVVEFLANILFKLLKRKSNAINCCITIYKYSYR